MKVGSQVKAEIDQVMAMIDAVAGTASSYTESLAGATQQLALSKDREGLRVIVENLVATTKAMERSNLQLEERLNASKKEINDLQVSLEAVRTESLTDPLTQLANRKYFDGTLEKSIADAAEKNEPLSLMLTDVDHFKAFNDNFGHLTGDQVLRLVAMSVKNNVKGKDTAARYGGEEFAVILPNTILRAATTVADHIRREVMSKELMKRSTGEQLGHVTDFDRRRRLAQRRYATVADRARRRLPLCGEAQRPQSRRSAKPTRKSSPSNAAVAGRLDRPSSAAFRRRQLHRFPAAACAGLVRIVEDELRRQLFGLVIHLCPEEEQHRFGIDQDLDALVLDDLVGRI